ncbi:MAG TPA: ATP-binding protein, partial [Catenuloplanes sp.]
TGEQEAVTFAALSSGQLSEEQYSSFVATLTGQQEALVAFALSASATQQALVNSTVTGDAVTLADQTSTQLSRSVGRSTQLSAAEATRSIGAVTDLMRWAEIRLEQQMLAEASAASSAVTRQAAVEAILVLLTLVLAVALAVVLARSLNRALRKLREGALSVANRDLPDAVARLRDVRDLGEGAAEDILRQVRDPIQLTNRDEIGQVAQAFNVVHREAVRIAAEQAALRTSVSAMFLNLARRSQALVDRMIGELDQIERAEEDPKRLAQLFELDHLATRMRRNDENLLVLAGADSSPPRREDALLVDALRAAQSEVELYNRVEFGTVDTDIAIAANAVNDVVRLIAELLDNATRFSPPTTVVVADARRIRDYVVVQVEDRGLGMSEEQMAALNRRLAQPPTVDVGAFRLMGLAVVGRLAARYGVRVELRANIEGGTVAQVTLPTAIVVLPRTRTRESIPARSPRAVGSGPAPVGSGGGGWPDAMAPALATTGGTTDTWATDTWGTPRGGWSAASGAGGEQQPASLAARGAGALPEHAMPARLRDSQPAPVRAPLEQRVPGRSGLLEPAATTQQLPATQPRPAAQPGPVAHPGPATQPGPVAQPGPATQPGPVAQPGPVIQPSTARPAVPPPGPARTAADQRHVTPPVIAPATDLSDSMASPTAAYPTLRAGSAANGTGVFTANGGTVPATVPPVAGPAGTPPPAPVNGWGAALAAMPAPPVPPPVTRVDDRGEAPIYRAMEAVWFRAHDQPATAEWAMPTAGYAPPPLAGAGDRTAAGMPVGPVAGSGNVGGYGSTTVVPDGVRPAPYAAAAARDTATAAERTYPPPAPVPADVAPPGPVTRSGTWSAAGSGAPTGDADRRAGDRPAGGSGDRGADRPEVDAGRFAGGTDGVTRRPDHPTGRAGNDEHSTGRLGDDEHRASRAGDDEHPTGHGVGRAGGPLGGAPTASGGGSAGGHHGGATAAHPVVPGQRQPVEDSWRTAADEGWSRASAAAEPAIAGTTRSGLPKRVPQAQLVPGGIKARSGGDKARRTPDEVRGLLSAYHRGVQRGRSAGSAEAAATQTPPFEEIDN